MYNSPSALEARLTAPDATQKDETPGEQAEGPSGQRTTDSSDCAVLAPADQASKHFDTLRAHLAIAGYELRCSAEIDGGVTYIVARWGHCRELADLDAVARWVDAAIGRRPAS